MVSGKAVWKLATVTFALTTGAALIWHPLAPKAPGRAPTAAARAAGVSPAALGMRLPRTGGEDELLAAVQAARSAPELTAALDRLAPAATERSLDVLVGFADDPRAGVAEAAVRALGAIDGDQATAVVISLAASGRPRVRGVAVNALGRSASRDARALLEKLAGDRRSDMRDQA